MPVADGFVAYVLEQLEVVGDISSKRMFGGVGIYAGDLFFAIIARDLLYFKVDDSNRGEYEAVGAKPFSPYGDARGAMGYYEVPVAVLEDAGELTRWAGKSIAVAAAKQVRKTKSVGHENTKTRRRKGNR